MTCFVAKKYPLGRESKPSEALTNWVHSHASYNVLFPLATQLRFLSVVRKK